jgi:hypothetical protein
LCDYDNLACRSLWQVSVFTGHGIWLIRAWWHRLGSLLGGYLGSRIGLHGTLFVGAFGMLVGFLPLLTSPIPGLRHLGVK